MSISAFTKAAVTVAGLAASIAPGVGGAWAADFSGKTIEILIGFGPGGGHDAYARALAPFYGRNLPGNPAVVTRNMPGAGSLLVLNHIATVASGNGLTLGTFDPQLLIAPLLGDKNARYDVNRLNWIGSIVDGTNVCITWTQSGVSTWEDLMSNKIINFGSTGPAAALYQHTAILKNMFHSKVNMVSGYAGTAEVRMAMERGEIAGNCGDNWASLKSTAADLIAQNKISIPVQFATKKHPELPDVPLVLDQATTEEDRAALRVLLGAQATGRPYAVAPGTAPDIVAALRDGFDKTMADPEFQQFASKMRLDLNPVRGADMAKLLADIYRTPERAVERAKAVIR